MISPFDHLLKNIDIKIGTSLVQNYNTVKDYILLECGYWDRCPLLNQTFIHSANSNN